MPSGRQKCPLHTGIEIFIVKREQVQIDGFVLDFLIFIEIENGINF